MAKLDNNIRLVPSVLDRLIDEHPKVSQEPVPNRYQNVRQLKRSVARDLEALLNTRQETDVEMPSDFNEVNRSLLMYGLPDFTSVNLLNQEDRNRIRRSLERSIATFEPRLERVRVNLESRGEHDRAVRFRIDAFLRIEPTREAVTFDAVLQLNTQEYRVRGED
jgi:type VI secretion system protein ImpF